MKHSPINFLIYLFFVLFISCQNNATQENTTAQKNETFDTTITAVESLINQNENYLENRDFDGDSIYDYLSFKYTGGAHCCYKMVLKLSSKNDTNKYPFEMDGGYGFGIVDGSQHDKFNIADYDKDGLPEIFMEISTYNGKKEPINAEWTNTYGIKTNFIIFNYTNKNIILEDYDSYKFSIKHNL